MCVGSVYYILIVHIAESRRFGEIWVPNMAAMILPNFNYGFVFILSFHLALGRHIGDRIQIQNAVTTRLIEMK